MRGRRVEDLPEGLTPAAKKARNEFFAFLPWLH